MTKLPLGVHPRTLCRVLPLLVAPVLIGLSMLVQRPLSRWLGVTGPVWPLLPFAPSVRWSHRLSLRGAGLLFTFLLVLGGIFVQTKREQRLLPRVKVPEGTAAAAAGVQTNDLIIAVDGVGVDDFGALREQILSGSQTKRLTLVRDGVTLEREATLREGVLGVQASGEERPVTRGEALRDAARMLLTLPSAYARLLLRVPPDEAPGPAAVPVASVVKARPLWLLAITLSLAFSWWLQLAVELGALGLGVLVDRPSIRRRGA